MNRSIAIRNTFKNGSLINEFFCKHVLSRLINGYLKLITQKSETVSNLSTPDAPRPMFTVFEGCYSSGYGTYSVSEKFKENVGGFIKLMGGKVPPSKTAAFQTVENHESYIFVIFDFV